MQSKVKILHFYPSEKCRKSYPDFVNNAEFYFLFIKDNKFYGLWDDGLLDQRYNARFDEWVEWINYENMGYVIEIV